MSLTFMSGCSLVRGVRIVTQVMTGPQGHHKIFRCYLEVKALKAAIKSFVFISGGKS